MSHDEHPQCKRYLECLPYTWDLFSNRRKKHDSNVTTGCNRHDAFHQLITETTEISSRRQIVIFKTVRGSEPITGPIVRSYTFYTWREASVVRLIFRERKISIAEHKSFSTRKKIVKSISVICCLTYFLNFVNKHANAVAIHQIRRLSTDRVNSNLPIRRRVLDKVMLYRTIKKGGLRSAATACNRQTCGDSLFIALKIFSMWLFDY